MIVKSILTVVSNRENCLYVSYNMNEVSSHHRESAKANPSSVDSIVPSRAL